MFPTRAEATATGTLGAAFLACCLAAPARLDCDCSYTQNPPPMSAASNNSHNRVRPLAEAREGRRSCSCGGSLVSMMSCMFALIPLLDNSSGNEFIRYYLARFHHFRVLWLDKCDLSDKVALHGDVVQIRDCIC